MIFETEPVDFVPLIHVASCIIDFDERFLLLRRHGGKWQGGKWNLPGGQLDEGESEEQAAIREVLEETGISLSSEQLLQPRKLYVKYEGDEGMGSFDLVYTVFVVRLDSEPEIRLDFDDHTKSQWVTPREIEDFPMMPEEADIIELALTA